MKSEENGNTALIIKSYRENFSRVLKFIVTRINCVEDAENLTQDVWMRLLSYAKPLSPETLTPLIFVIARNLINDYLRRLCHCRAYQEEWMQNNENRHELSPETLVSANQIAAIERKRVKCLPAQRRTIYIMSRYSEKTTDDIAQFLSLSKRTVENHLRLGRHDVRNYIAAAI